MDFLGVLHVSAMVVLFLCGSLLIWNDVRFRRKGLPPGTMGWPFFGETREIFTNGIVALKTRKARYGDIFKTHVLGRPVIVSMDPDLNKYVLMNEKAGLVPSSQKSSRDILGQSNVSSVRGPTHKTMRGALHSVVNPTMIKDGLLSKVDGFMNKYLTDWGGKVVDLQEKTKNMAFLSALYESTSISDGPSLDTIKDAFFKMYFGTQSFPINIPGTTYSRGLQARKVILKFVRETIEEREASGKTYDDMLESLTAFRDHAGERLSETQILDMITLLYSGLENLSTTSMMATKFLLETPGALQELRKEHLKIRKRKAPGEPINWDDYRSMEFTRGVVYETLRLATVVVGVMRKSLHDMNFKGYLIPKGWNILIYNREINYDPLMYPDPYVFNPWRWLDKTLATHNHFMLFGGGTRLCVGRELGIAKVTIFLHYFVTRYSWEFVGTPKITPFPRVYAPNGLYIKVTNMEDCERCN